MGAQVNIGLRPEDLTEASGDFIYQGKVDFVEALGEVTLLYFESDGIENAVLGKLPGTHKDLRGKTISLTTVPEKVQIFKNGISLHYR